jgi:hypothetical protein
MFGDPLVNAVLSITCLKLQVNGLIQTFELLSLLVILKCYVHATESTNVVLEKGCARAFLACRSLGKEKLQLTVHQRSV